MEAPFFCLTLFPSSPQIILEGSPSFPVGLTCIDKFKHTSKDLRELLQPQELFWYSMSMQCGNL